MDSAKENKFRDSYMYPAIALTNSILKKKQISGAFLHLIMLCLKLIYTCFHLIMLIQITINQTVNQTSIQFIIDILTLMFSS